ncbi:hypothetical protein DFJ73DRAFT_654388 [Zopfochytrium polystomum]|nr:hypothetical protein DFJ73DRAFT_654388 [Zopfochytrium polystomum]
MARPPHPSSLVRGFDALRPSCHLHPFRRVAAARIYNSTSAARLSSPSVSLLTPTKTTIALAAATAYRTEVRRFTAAATDESSYHKAADARLESLVDELEELGEGAEYDVVYSSGVLTLKTGPRGTYVINKQPPNKQIWFSSPIRQAMLLFEVPRPTDTPTASLAFSGPRRFELREGGWRDPRTDVLLEDILARELSDILSKPVQFSKT